MKQYTVGVIKGSCNGNQEHVVLAAELSKWLNEYAKKGWYLHTICGIGTHTVTAVFEFDRDRNPETVIRF